MPPQTRNSRKKKGETTDAASSTPADPARDGSRAEPSDTVSPGEQEAESSSVQQLSASLGLNQLGIASSFFVDGEELWTMEEFGAPAGAKTHEGKFNGRNETMLVSELKIKVQNRLSLLMTRRSASAPSLTAMESFAVLLESCEGDAYHALHDHFRERLETAIKERTKIDEKNKANEQKLIKAWHDKLDAGQDPGAFHPGPKLMPDEDKTLMDDAWTFLQKTYPEQTAAALRDYLLFSYDKSRTTQGMFHRLRELIRLNKKTEKGREVVEKAVFALKPELRRAVEHQTLTWGEEDLTLTKLEATCRQIEEALYTRELGRAPVKMVKGDLAGKMGGMSLSGASSSKGNERKRESSEDGESKPKIRSKGERRREKKEKQAFAAGPSVFFCF